MTPRVTFVASIHPTLRPASLDPGGGLISPQNASAYVFSGLFRGTKCCMTNVVVLAYTELWFSPAPGTPPRPDPRLGVLHPSLLSLTKAALQAARLL